ncbi:GrpE protein HSP-70 cofactor [Mycolicibacterium mageritense DSM 44476 = CIP 104973]|uniref:nucleotide exchange factor GrpE n=1 Tax=Mycolicibacterium mageritense TaxID=53462 RepID=UPI001E418875|nr:nucleotide exchange factor GrpE [Mycolicibacterium mageritense]MCC9185554.1 nucleotide exchange factor GrpE [Mycolicibacterium mageritense]
MTYPEAEEPVTFTDKRRIDPQTGEVRESAASGAALQGAAPEAPGGQERGDSGTGQGGDKVAELTADLQRVQADFANYRKRALRDQEAARERAKAVVVSQLLPVIDDLDRARSHGDLDAGPLKSVADKLAAALTGLGVVEFGTGGEAFDPSLHEAVQHEGDGSNPVIGTVMRKGYKLGEFVLRPAMVGVVDAVEVTDSHDTPDDDQQSGAQNAESHQ